jgi:UDP-N-acetylmuramyl pentapeptide phosphotransferase/UDP-N-acetylglucosamine-1-phosphate transferase
MDSSAPVSSGHIDWSLIASVVSLVLVIPLGIASNLLTPLLIAYLQKRKLVKTNRSKEQELANYKRVEAFKNGTRDRYSFYILAAVAAVISSVGLATCLVLLALQNWNLFDHLNPVLLILAVFLGVFAVLFMDVIAETARHIEQFEQYQAEIRRKWGDDVI